MLRKVFLLLAVGLLVAVPLENPAEAAKDDCKLKGCVWDAPGFTGKMETPQGKGSNCVNFPIQSAANQYPSGLDIQSGRASFWLRIYGGADCKGEVIAELKPGQSKDVNGRSAGGGREHLVLRNSSSPGHPFDKRTQWI